MGQKYLEQKRFRGRVPLQGKKNNVFQEYSPYFFAPLLQLLQDFYQRHAKNTVPASSSSSSSLLTPKVTTISEKEPFNLIDQTFSSHSKSAQREDQSDLQTLRLPSSRPSSNKRPLIEEINESADVQLSNRQSKDAEVKPSKSRSKDSLLPDDTDLLLPYDALLSLSVFMNYYIFHPQYQ